ncbi:Dihydroxyacetone kinase [Porphyridium purpureum]|uniref:Dihydroxyacetone kinase n=1 Tax=Porphyridium purpureum TaxID=35688 RepID=A0A5J4Z0A8_PORPP|nr:Dihydroxyacetone kinase [Porphyridium purpureum]|eukprot:POR7802..scf209_3
MVGVGRSLQGSQGRMAQTDARWHAAFVPNSAHGLASTPRGGVHLDLAPRRVGAMRMSGEPVRKRMYNPSHNIVEDAIKGALQHSGGALARLEYQNSVRVVVRNDDTANRKVEVALLSGGGSGHEPSHAGWVGEGMLSAAVCGDVFASPSTEAVLAGIKAVAGEKGALIIVKNYTGDRLNFGVALEKAKKNGIPCRMLIVGDDIAIEDAPQPRGIAGVVLVHKLAGAAAQKGYDLDKVHEIASAAAKNVYSIGMSMTVCSQPGSKPSDRLDGDLVEYGLGIHGEPGVERRTMGSSAETCSHLVEFFSKRLGEDKKSKPYALLVNNLGSLPPLEMSVVVGDACEALHKAGFTNIDSVMVNTAMTSLDMAGFSLTLLDVSCHDEVRELLYAPTTASAWVQPKPYKADIEVKPCPAPEEATFEAPKTLDAAAKLKREVIKRAAESIIKAEPDLTAADLIVGDGDCGLTLKQGAERVIADLDKLPLNSNADLLSALGICVGNSMGGTSGILYSLGFQGAAAEVDKQGWLGGLKAGTEAIMFYGGAKKGMRTMIDALVPALEAENADQAAEAAVKGAASTASMGKAGAGRSSYIPAEDMKGTADPGATAVGIWLKAAVEAYNELK